MSKSVWAWDSVGDCIELIAQDGGVYIDVVVTEKTRTATEEKLAKLACAMNQHDGLVERESAFLRLMDADHASWVRWHDLITIREGRGLSPDEQTEYDDFQKIVEMLDERDAAPAEHAEVTG